MPMASLEETPPLSPVLLLGMAARPLPPAVVEAVLRQALRRVQAGHPEVFARLRPLGDTAFLIDPVDVPFKAVVRPGAQPPALCVVRDDQPAPAAAVVISGALATLTDLLQGRADGDALFFSRDLAIEGDTEAALTLRNALDGADIDVFEIMLAVLGPLAGPARRLARPGRTLLRGLRDDMGRVQAALTAPLARRCAAQAAELAALEDQVGELRRRLHQRPARTRSG